MKLGNAVEQGIATGKTDADAPTVTPDDAYVAQGGTVLPALIEPETFEAEETIGGMEKFLIPDEGEEKLLEEHELDVDAKMGYSIRKPDGCEFFMVQPASLFTTHILCYKANPEGMGETLLYVAPKLRGKITRNLRQVKFFLCYSCKSRRFFIWPVKVSNTKWYQSLEILFKEPKEFFKVNFVRVEADMELGKYRIFSEPTPDAVNWPDKPMQELVTEAIGQSNIITRPDHPVYKELTSGTKLK